MSRFPLEKPEQSFKLDMEYDENVSLILLVEEALLLCEEGRGRESASDNSQTPGSSSSALSLSVTSDLYTFPGLHILSSSLAIYGRKKKPVIYSLLHYWHQNAMER